jgi:hypothetical protein
MADKAGLRLSRRYRGSHCFNDDRFTVFAGEEKKRARELLMGPE